MFYPAVNSSTHKKNPLRSGLNIWGREQFVTDERLDEMNEGYVLIGILEGIRFIPEMHL